jgi:large subunit ribosomal protein L25
VDFQRVARDRKIHMKVPLHFMNQEIAPGVKTGGGAVNHVLSEIDVSCLPDDLPEFIEVDLSNLQLGHSIHLSELKLPQGVESTQLRSSDAVVVTIVMPRAEVEPEAEAAPVEGAVAAAPAAPAGAEKAEPEKKKEGDKK